MSSRQRRWQLQQIQKGKCPSCGQSRNGSRSLMCAVCAEKNNELKRRLRAARRRRLARVKGRKR